jgi:uncharacterized cupredoxin-like copper-binding protein
MATTTEQRETYRPDSNGIPATSTDARLRAIETEVVKQGRGIRSAQRAWGVFAFMALVIAAANLIVEAAKLDNKSSSSPAPAAAAPAAAAPAATPGKIGVSLKEFSINPTVSQAPAGRVTFGVKNSGTVPHEFVVLRTDKPAGSLLNGAKADETGNVGETGDLAPGASKKLSLNPKAGHYALICNLPGHYKAGQHTDFSIR